MAIRRDELREAFRSLTVDPLEGPDDPRYVVHPEADRVIRAVRSRLDLAAGEGQVILFSGHRGTGKSTELCRLSHELEGEYTPIRFSLVDFADPLDLDSSDLLLAILSTVAERVSAGVLGKAVARLGKSLREMLGGQVFDAGAVSMRFVSADRRVMIREELAREQRRMLDEINSLLSRLKRPIVVVDDLDKASVSQALSLYQRCGPILMALRCSSIHCVPIAMLQSAQMPASWEYQVEILNPVEVKTREGDALKDGVDTLSTVVTKRVPRDWFAPGALSGLVLASGGLLRDLVSMTAECLVRLDVGKRDLIDIDLVAEVIRKKSSELQLRLDVSLQESLKIAHAKKGVSSLSNAAANTLIDGSLLLVHPGSPFWYDVHPLLEPLVSGHE